ncbi:MAG: hypothetical protein AAFW84_12550 [Cyanobacteria bacterium J06635_15]
MLFPTLNSKSQRYRYFIVGAIAALILLLTTTTSSSGQRSEQAHAADNFIDMIGVVTHLRYLDTAYKNYDDIIKPRLQELGLRHIRDGLSLEDETSRNKVLDLGESGIHATLVMDPRWIKTPENAVALVKAAAPAVEAVEGPNEWDVWPDLTYKGNSFPAGLKQFQAELYEALKQDPDTAEVAVLSPAIAHWWNAPKVGRVSCDFGTMHSYAGGKLPSTRKLDTNWIPSARLLCPDQPIVATETGWHNAVDHTNAPQPGISEAASGKYIPRLYLEYFNRQIKRAFTYELINEWTRDNQESNFGLLRYDGSRKPAFVALRNLIDLLADPGDAFTPDALNYTLSGNLDRVHHTLLQKRDRRFYLVLWQEVSSFNLETKRDTAVGDRPLTLTLDTPAAEVKTYRPVTAATPLTQETNLDRLELNVPDHPLVIEMSF